MTGFTLHVATGGEGEGGSDNEGGRGWELT